MLCGALGACVGSVVEIIASLGEALYEILPA